MVRSISHLESEVVESASATLAIAEMVAQAVAQAAKKEPSAKVLLGRASQTATAATEAAVARVARVVDVVDIALPCGR